MSASGPRRPSRRAALRTIVVGAALAGLGGAVALVRGRGYDVDRGRPTLALAPSEVAVILHAARRIAAPDRPGDGAVPSADDVDVAGFVDAYVSRMPAPMRRDVSRALLYLEQVAPITVGLASRFTRLSPEDQDRVLSAVESSSVAVLRGVFACVKSLVFMGYYRDPRTWRVLGYDGPWLRRGAPDPARPSP
jgi:hypothetical protein